MKNKKIEFEAELRSVEAKKLICNDMEYKIILNTNNPIVLKLGELSPETTLKVEINYV